MSQALVQALLKGSHPKGCVAMAPVHRGGTKAQGEGLAQGNSSKWPAWESRCLGLGCLSKGRPREHKPSSGCWILPAQAEAQLWGAPLTIRLDLCWPLASC